MRTLTLRSSQLQDDYQGAIAGGGSREQTSTTIGADGLFAPPAAAPAAAVSRAHTAPAQSVAAGSRTWVTEHKSIGEHVPVTELIPAFPGSSDADRAKLKDKTIRQLGRGQKDAKGNDASGNCVVSDAAGAYLFDDPANASRWANNVNLVNTDIAPSLTYIPSGNPAVRERIVYVSGLVLISSVHCHVTQVTRHSSCKPSFISGSDLLSRDT